MQRLVNKVALVTGASRGIGRGIALCLAEEGADVMVNYRSHAEEAQQVVESIAAMGRRALAWQADVADRSQVQRMIHGCVEHFGRLDIAVANAVSSVRQPLLTADWDGVQRTVNVALFGTFHTCQLAAQHMVAQGQGGKIVIISSIVTDMVFGSAPVYSMCKAAIEQMGRMLANELARYHINVNIVKPGWTDTPGERAFYSEDDLQRGARRIPWGRLGTPWDIGRCVAYLASDDADYVTGSAIAVDGGYMGGLELPLRE